MCGGRHESWDPNAPKEIQSKNIVEFSAYFCAYNRFGGNRPEFHNPSVKKDSNTGEFVLSVDGRDLKTDKDFMDKLQELIDKNHLVSENGHSLRVDGLPPEYQPYSFKAVYDSGEELSFNVGGNPGAPWCVDLRKLLCKELVKHGIEDMLPPKADRNVVRFDLKLYDWPRNVQYNNIYMEDDDQGGRCFHYMKNVWNRETDQNECDRIIKVDEAFFERPETGETVGTFCRKFSLGLCEEAVGYALVFFDCFHVAAYGAVAYDAHGLVARVGKVKEHL